MKSILDESSIEVPCPHCGNKFSERLGKLKTNPKLTCPSCGGSISINADQAGRAGRELKKVDDAVADLRKSLGRLGKLR